MDIHHVKSTTRGKKTRCYRDHKRKHTPLQRIQKDMVDGLRHIEGIRGSIAVASESGFTGTTSRKEKQVLKVG